MAQKIGIDSSIFIYLFENSSSLGKHSETLLEKVELGDLSAVLSVIGLIEILTGPKKLKRYDMAWRYREFISHFPNLATRDINVNVADLASDLRARYGISTLDAIRIATAIDFGAEKFYTNNKQLKKVKEVKVELI